MEPSKVAFPSSLEHQAAATHSCLHFHSFPCSHCSKNTPQIYYVDFQWSSWARVLKIVQKLALRVTFLTFCCTYRNDWRSLSSRFVPKNELSTPHQSMFPFNPSEIWLWRRSCSTGTNEEHDSALTLAGKIHDNSEFCWLRWSATCLDSFVLFVFLLLLMKPPPGIWELLHQRTSVSALTLNAT